MGFSPTILGMSMESVARSCTGDLESDKEDAIACAKSATTKFKTQLVEEPDRSDYYARKGCNYVTTLADECHACLPNTVYNLEKMRDDAIERFLETALELPEFNAKKCPVTREYFARKDRETEGQGKEKPVLDYEKKG